MLLLELCNSVGLVLLVLSGQGLLKAGEVGRATRPVLLVELEVLGELLLETAELGLELGLLETLRLLVIVDDLGLDELVEGLALVRVYQGIGLGSIDLREHKYKSVEFEQCLCWGNAF